MAPVGRSAHVQCANPQAPQAVALAVVVPIAWPLGLGVTKRLQGLCTKSRVIKPPGVATSRPPVALGMATLTMEPSLLSVFWPLSTS